MLFEQLIRWLRNDILWESEDSAPEAGNLDSSESEPEIDFNEEIESADEDANKENNY